MLRALQLGLHIRDLELLDCGDLIDLLIESHNDGEKYPMEATTEFLDSFFGGF